MLLLLSVENGGEMKYGMFIALLLLLECTAPNASLFSQTGPESLGKVEKACNSGPRARKYKHYRYRFLGDGSRNYPGFIRLGTGMGESLPIDALLPDTDCYFDYVLNERDCMRPDAPGPVGNIRFSDASQDLGYYIAVLATEFELNRIQKKPQNHLVKELWMALKAFDRLDAGAEQWYDTDPQLDGFFLRDDVPGDHFEDPETGELDFPHPDPDVPGYQCLSSAWSCGDNSVNDGTFCSQDQMIYVLTGFALVDKFIPESVQYAGDTLVAMARRDVHRMVDHLRSHDWSIRAPDDSSPPAEFGGSAQVFSYKFAELADLLTHNRYFGPSYQDSYSENTGLFLWVLAEELFSTQPTINRAMILTLSAITHNWEAGEMAAKCAESDMELFALMQSVVYEEALGDSIPLEAIAKLVDSAPFNGPCDDSPGCENVPGWRTSNRWLHPDLRNGDPNLSAAQFNGLDFMLLHNLNEIYRYQQDLNEPPLPCPEPPISRLEGLRIFPNPTAGRLIVEFYEEEAGRIAIQLYDGMGKMVKKEKRETWGSENVQFAWDLNDLPAGVYWLSVDRDGAVMRTGVVKQ